MENDDYGKKIKGYRLFSAFFGFGNRFRKKKKAVFFVMTHDGGPSGNCGTMLSAVKKKGVKTYVLTREETSFGHNPLKAFVFFVIKSFQMSACHTIFMDNAFLPLGFMKLDEGVRVAMLWHGTGTIKRFGLDTTQGGLRDLEEACYSKITHLFVASDYTAEIYKNCFGLPKEKIFVTGSPRCDELFRAAESGEDIRDKERFTVLFATTFRENVPGEVPFYEIRTLLRKLQNRNRKVHVLLRMHPYVSLELQGRSEFFMFGNCTDVSGQDNLNLLMKKADILITDYSSICYDFAILNRPILFYAPDMNYYKEEERGFYEDYESFVPGPVYKKIDDLGEAILNMASDPKKPDLTKREEFMNKAYAYRDAASAERILEVLKL